MIISRFSVKIASHRYFRGRNRLASKHFEKIKQNSRNRWNVWTFPIRLWDDSNPIQSSTALRWFYILSDWTKYLVGIFSTKRQRIPISYHEKSHFFLKKKDHISDTCLCPNILISKRIKESKCRLFSAPVAHIFGGESNRTFKNILNSSVVVQCSLGGLVSVSLIHFFFLFFGGPFFYFNDGFYLHARHARCAYQTT